MIDLGLISQGNGGGSSNLKIMKKEKRRTRFFRLGVDPFGESRMDLLTREEFGLVGSLEAIPEQIRAYV